MGRRYAQLPRVCHRRQRFLTPFALIALGIILWRPPRLTAQLAVAHDLVRAIMILFVVRGMFSREVFLVGPFPMALGLAIGLMLVCSERARRSSMPNGAA